MSDRRHFRLYGRGGCSPCLAAHAMLDELARAGTCSFEWIDVDLDPGAPPAYSNEVPVLELDGRVVARGRISRAMIEDALAE